MTAPTDPCVRPGERGQRPAYVKDDAHAWCISNADEMRALAASHDLFGALRIAFQAGEANARATIADQAAEIAQLTSQWNFARKQEAERSANRGYELLAEAEARVAALVEALSFTTPFADASDRESFLIAGGYLRRAARLVSGEAKDAPSSTEGERS